MEVMQGRSVRRTSMDCASTIQSEKAPCWGKIWHHCNLHRIPGPWLPGTPLPFIKSDILLTTNVVTVLLLRTSSYVEPRQDACQRSDSMVGCSTGSCISAPLPLG